MGRQLMKRTGRGSVQDLMCACLVVSTWEYECSAWNRPDARSAGLPLGCDCVYVLRQRGILGSGIEGGNMAGLWLLGNTLLVMDGSA